MLSFLYHLKIQVALIFMEENIYLIVISFALVSVYYFNTEITLFMVLLSPLEHAIHSVS